VILDLLCFGSIKPNLIEYSLFPDRHASPKILAFASAHAPAPTVDALKNKLDEAVAGNEEAIAIP
jgi:hypothetical protein